MSTHTLILRYTAFAILATLANLATQRVVMASGENAYHFAGAVGLGTIVGLVVKYILDKRWIFMDFEGGLQANSRQFSLYMVMGIATTAIFWGTETLFWVTWRTDLMREVGAIIGLSVGYVVKYNLDKRFVFNQTPRATA